MKYSRLVALVTIFLPPLVTLVFVAFLWGEWIGWFDLIVFLSAYSLTVFAISAGYHRHFAHRSFKAKGWFRAFMGVSGAMAAQGPIKYWVAHHRLHHRESDSQHDPHSPHTHGEGVIENLKGLWHAHLGWMLQPMSKKTLYLVRDLQRDPLVRWVDRYYFFWIILGLLLPGLISMIFLPYPDAFIRGVFWGGFFRIFAVHHMTWSVNSICHLVGEAPYETNDQSKNNPVFGLLAFGEGWHNNHHAFPASAQFGLKRYELDLTYRILFLLSMVGVTSQLKKPSWGEKKEKVKRLA